MYQTIKTQVADGICTITINRPEKMNALNRELIDELGAALDEVLSKDDIKGAILTGAGDKAFVAGADISEFTELASKGGAELARIGQEKVFSKIEQAAKPIIAAVNGFALGGGCELAMACHFRTASTAAKFGQPEVNLGLIPGYGGTQRLVQLIGKGKAMELLMTGDMVAATEAKALGLANYVYEPEELMEQSTKLMAKILKKAPLAVGRIIALVNEAATVSKTGLENEIKAFGACFDTEDKKEGTAAFLEKRKPSFVGK